MFNSVLVGVPEPAGHGQTVIDKGKVELAFFQDCADILVERQIQKVGIGFWVAPRPGVI
jgi:hypothetical protein